MCAGPFAGQRQRWICAGQTVDGVSGVHPTQWMRSTGARLGAAGAARNWRLDSAAGGDGGRMTRRSVLGQESKVEWCQYKRERSGVAGGVSKSAWRCIDNGTSRPGGYSSCQRQTARRRRKIGTRRQNWSRPRAMYLVLVVVQTGGRWWRDVSQSVGRCPGAKRLRASPCAGVDGIIGTSSSTGMVVKR